MNLISDTIQCRSDQLLIFSIHHQASIIMAKIVCLIPLLLCLCSVLGLQPITPLQALLPPGSKKQLNVPVIFQGYQKLQLSLFYNQNTNKSTSPCILKLKVRSFFQSYGQLNHDLHSPSDKDFWQGGNLWDSIEVGNRLVCVFESGEVSEFQTKAFQTTYKPIERIRSSMPFSGDSINYGKLVHHQQNGDHILYVSQSGCYLINPNSSWSPFTGFNNNPDFQQAKIYNKKLFVTAGSVIYIYSVDVASLSLGKQSQISLFFTQMGEQFDLPIYKLEYDFDSNKMYVINGEEGVKYFNLNTNQSRVEVSHLLPSQNCQDMLISQGLLFLSCSYFTIANASTSKLIYKQQYSFHVKKIIINEMVLTVFGETSFAVFWITGQGANSAKIRLLYKGELPLGKYQSFLYLPGTKMLMLLGKNGLSYGKIIADQHIIECSYLKALEGKSSSYPHVFGENSANLTIYGLCGEKQGIQLECSEMVRINVTIPDVKSYKFIVLLVVVAVALILSMIAIWKVVQLRNRKNALKYKELVEQTLSTVHVNQKEEKVVAEMMKLQN